MVKKETGEKTSFSSSSSLSSAVNDKHHKRRYTSKQSVRPKKECADMVMKTTRIMNNRIINEVELPETKQKR